jgi:pyrimidine operon attenuation protein/uracil phosphoribosyltransferase
MSPVPIPDAEALYAHFRAQIAAALGADATLAPFALVGIASGGAWIAERLHRDIGRTDWSLGVVSSTMHRDDHALYALQAQAARTELPFRVEGCHILLIDDVLLTGRTIRAAINELFDFGRPASVRLGVLVDRQAYQLPIRADYCALALDWPRTDRLSLLRDDSPDLRFRFAVESSSP